MQRFEWTVTQRIESYVRDLNAKEFEVRFCDMDMMEVVSNRPRDWELNLAVAVFQFEKKTPQLIRAVVSYDAAPLFMVKQTMAFDAGDGWKTDLMDKIFPGVSYHRVLSDTIATARIDVAGCLAERFRAVSSLKQQQEWDRIHLARWDRS